MADRPSAAARGYDAKWRLNSARYLKVHRTCCLCGEPATVPDHWPLSRRQLLEMGIEHPDAWERLRPLCAQCHGKSTAALQPGGWNQQLSIRRPAERHPGLI